jgi:predicted DCC family thiol-disulfide oxidoreductase YuxK
VHREHIILFDGVCNLCNGAVQFIIKRDRKKKFCFGSLQGAAGQHHLRHFNLPTAELTSFVLIENEKAYTRSTAALRTAKHLGGAWSLLYAFIIVPRFLRDGVYNWIAKNRYKWFGQKEACPIPTPEQRSRFID